MFRLTSVKKVFQHIFHHVCELEFWKSLGIWFMCPRSQLKNDKNTAWAEITHIINDYGLLWEKSRAWLVFYQKQVTTIFYYMEYTEAEVHQWLMASLTTDLQPYFLLFLKFHHEKQTDAFRSVLDYASCTVPLKKDKITSFKVNFSIVLCKGHRIVTFFFFYASVFKLEILKIQFDFSSKINCSRWAASNNNNQHCTMKPRTFQALKNWLHPISYTFPFCRCRII